MPGSPDRARHPTIRRAAIVFLAATIAFAALGSPRITSVAAKDRGEVAGVDSATTQPSRLKARPELDASAYKKEIARLRDAYAMPRIDWPKPTVDAGVRWKELGSVLPPEFPEGNPFSKEKTQLGQRLFFDPRLSSTRQMACASCHDPDLGWADGKTNSFGHNRQPLPRNTPAIMNSFEQKYWFWDGRAESLEEQVATVLANPDEMNAGGQEIADWLAKNTDYGDRFAKAFGSREITFERVTQAIATFIRTIQSGRSSFDKFIAGDHKALSDSALRGLHLFRTDARCMNCHHGPNFSDNEFHDLGLSYYGRKFEDLGRYNVTKNPKDVGALKTPTLRNVTRTSPYTHVGFFELDGVLNLYNAGMPTPRPRGEQAKDPLFPKKSPLLHPLGLNEQDLTDIKAFLKALEEPRLRIRPPEDLAEQLNAKAKAATTQPAPRGNETATATTKPS